MPKPWRIALAGALLVAAAAGAVAFVAPVPVPWSDADVAEARDKQRATDLLLARTALFAYFAKNGAYPPRLEALSPNFVRELPRDPLSGTEHGSSECATALESRMYTYRYTFESSGRAFLLFACFELGTDRLLTVRSYE